MADFEAKERCVLVPAGDDTPCRSPGERLLHLFEQCFDAFEQQEMTVHLAVDSKEGSLTSGELGQHPIRLGLGASDIVGFLFDRSIHTYISLLAVQKINAAYVPFDVTLPTERTGFVSEGAVVETVREIEYAGAA